MQNKCNRNLQEGIHNKLQIVQMYAYVQKNILKCGLFVKSVGYRHLDHFHLVAWGLAPDSVLRTYRQKRLTVALTASGKAC